MGKVQSQVVPVGTLTEAHRQEMLALMVAHYDGIDADVFFADLADKNDVFLFHAEGRLIGFSTILCRRHPGIPRATVLFSGDTVIDKEYWGRSFLQISFGRYVLLRKLSRPWEPLYWMLISKGYKTYLMMRRNYPWSFPQPGRACPERERQAMEAFYGDRFDGSYDRALGLIAKGSGSYAVKEEWSEPPPDLCDDPELQHFLRSNPHCRDGVELACIAEIRLRDYFAIFMKYTPRYLRLVKKT